MTQTTHCVIGAERRTSALLVANGHRRYDRPSIRRSFCAGLPRPSFGVTMTLRAAALRLPLLLASLALASACSSKEPATETATDTAPACNLFTGVGCDDTSDDTGADVTDDTAVDPDGSSEADGSGEPDTTPTGAAFGETCEVDSQCASGLCLVMPDRSICTQPCVTDCPADFACAPAMIPTSPSTDTCAPADFCQDGDGDTFGRGPACAGIDCDDTNARLNTVTVELCDNRDNDCDGRADEQVATDGDSCDTGLLGVCQNGTLTCVRGTNNCTPLQAAGTESCNGLDDDCDGETDEDTDGGALSAQCYSGTAGTAGIGICQYGLRYCAGGTFDACDGEVLPATEVCNGLDDNCNGIVDDGFTIAVYFHDGDGDGFGDIADPGIRTCNRPPSSATVTGDCNDDNPDIHPGATEIPGDDIDSNCDGNELCFADFDDDGVRTSTSTPVATTNCILAGYANAAMPGGDCDDTRPSVYPGATEVVADGRDNDCDGAELCFTDADSDGFRSEATISSVNLSCADAGEASSAAPLGDCDDNNSSRHPGVSDTCDEIDNDCDGLVDEDVSVLTFPDLDRDGYGDATAVGVFACLLVPGLSTNNLDCNDAVSAAFPGGVEITGDGIDGDCDTTEYCYRDQDRDGYRSDTATILSFTDTDCNDVGEALSTMQAGDCNDQTNALNPGRPELCRDGFDNNCNGVIDEVGFCI